MLRCCGSTCIAAGERRFHATFPQELSDCIAVDVDEMGRPARLPDSVRGQDVNDVSRLWRELGHTPKSIAQYQIAVTEILKRGRGFDYLEITADRVDSWAQQYAEEHGLDPAAVMRRWLPAFRAFAWGLKQIGKATGSVVRSKAQVAVDPTVEAFKEYGRSLGWKETTLFLHLRSLRELQHHVAGHRGKWPEPGLKDVDDFLRVAAQRWKRTTVAGAAGTFRAWLRFLFVTGRSKQNMAESVVLPPSIRYARPPRASRTYGPARVEFISQCIFMLQLRERFQPWMFLRRR
jgi:hypothetical protein